MRLVWVLLTVYAMVNVIAFTLYGIDKRRAKKNLWRIRERTLLLATGLFGGVGAWLGMKVFRHKTQHMVFKVLVPVMAIAQMLLMAFAVGRLL